MRTVNFDLILWALIPFNAHLSTVAVNHVVETYRACIKHTRVEESFSTAETSNLIQGGTSCFNSFKLTFNNMLEISRTSNSTSSIAY